MTPGAIERAALTDPDARPLTPADLRSMKRTPRIRVIRRALGSTQDDFSTRCRIPLGFGRNAYRNHLSLVW